MPLPKQFSDADLKRGAESVSAHAKIRAARPKRKDILAAAVPGSVKEGLGPKGTEWEANIPKAAFDEMMAPSRRLTHERGMKMQAGTTWLKTKKADGSTGFAAPEYEYLLSHFKGVRPVRAPLVGNLFEAGDGTLIRKDGRGRFTPTGHTHVGAPWPWQESTCPGCVAEAAA